MYRSNVRLVLFLTLALIVASSLMAGCQPVRHKTERANPDWSRGEALGKAALNGRVGFAADASQEAIYLAWVAERERNGPEFLYLVRLDRSGRLLGSGELPIEVNRPTQVQLLGDPAGYLHLAWLDRLGENVHLFYARLDAAGQLVSQPQELSLPEAEVTSYEMALGPSGDIEVFWGAREGESAGLYHLRLGEAGEIKAANRYLGRKGFNPTFRVDRQGFVHLVWEEEPSAGEHYLYYAIFDRDGRALKDPVSISSFAAGTGLVTDRPALGLAGDDVYIFWSRERRGGGLTPPSAESYCLTFPLGRPEAASKPRQVNVPATGHPAYTHMETPVRVSELAISRATDFPSTFIYQPYTIRGHYDALVAAFAVEISSRTKQATHIVLTLWADGQMRGYQIVNKTRTGSMRPVFFEDAQGDLHLAWIDVAGFGVYEVYYASTSAEARANLNRLTAQDVLASAFNFLWGIVQALSFFPIILVWIFVPLLVIILYSFLRVEGDLARLGPRIMLVVSLLLYTIFKYLFRPNWLAALPLPPNLSPGLSDALIYTAPLLISGLATVATILYIKRREYPSLLPSFGFFVACDALLTLLIYVPGIVAE